MLSYRVFKVASELHGARPSVSSPTDSLLRRFVCEVLVWVWASTHWLSHFVFFALSCLEEVLGNSIEGPASRNSLQNYRLEGQVC